MKGFLKYMLGGFLFLALIVSGCSPSGSSGADNGEKEKSGVEGKEDKVTLTMTSWRTEDKAGYEKIIAAFNEEHPEIEIKFEPVKNTEYDTILNTKLQSDSAADIIQLRPYAPGLALAKAGYLEPLNDVEGIDVFPEHVIEATQGDDGNIYGVPLSINSAQIFYNKKLFQEHSLETPNTWDELIEVAETLKKNGIVPFAFGSKEGWLLSLSHAIVGPAFYGGNHFVDQLLTGDTDFTSDAFKKSLQAMKELTPYFPDNYTGLGMDDIRNLFTTEAAGMFIMGSWEIEVIRQANPDLELGFFPMPAADEGEATMTTWVDGSYGVNAKSPHKEEAKKFMQFMTTETFGKAFSDTFKRISAVPGVDAEDALVKEMGETAEKISTPYMILVYFNEGNPTTKQVLETSLQGMYLDEMTPEQVAEELQKSADTWFQPRK